MYKALTLYLRNIKINQSLTASLEKMEINVIFHGKIFVGRLFRNGKGIQTSNTSMCYSA